MPRLPAVGIVTSARGTRGAHYHAGWDIAGKRGDVVVAPEPGTVVARWTNDTTKPYSGYGPAGVVIVGDSGFFHLLGHLLADDALLELGDQVGEGDVVGKMSGLNHTHWEVRTQQALTTGKTNEDITVDPADWLTAHAPTMPVVRPPPARTPTTPKRSSGGAVWLLLLLLLGARRWKS